MDVTLSGVAHWHHDYAVLSHVVGSHVSARCRDLGHLEFDLERVRALAVGPGPEQSVVRGVAYREHTRGARNCLHLRHQPDA